MIRQILAIAALAFCHSAIADSEARQGDDWVRITILPCSNEAVIASLEADKEDPQDYRAAMASVEGKSFSACYTPIPSKRVIYLRYEDGDGGVVPYDSLKPVREL